MDLVLSDKCTYNGVWEWPWEIGERTIDLHNGSLAHSSNGVMANISDMDCKIKGGEMYS